MLLELMKKIGGASMTAAGLRDALAEIDETALARAVVLAEVERREALLSGSERAVEKAEEALALARRELDRGRAIREELESRIALAAQDEARRVLDAERAAVEAEGKTVAADLRKSYPEAARKIVALLARLDAAEQRVAEVNEKLLAAGRPEERLSRVEDTALGSHKNHAEHVTSISALTSLRPVAGAPGFGQGAYAFELLGLAG